MQGTLPNLYHSLENLNDSYIQPNKTKETFLKPVAPVFSSTTSVPLLALCYEPTNKKFYSCSSCHNYFSDNPLADCSNCHRRLTRDLKYVASPVVEEAASSLDAGGLVKGVVTYMVIDDLVVKPMSTISSLTLLNKFKVKEVGALEEKVLTLGMDEVVKLLKISLDSKNVITQLYC